MNPTCLYEKIKGGESVIKGKNLLKTGLCISFGHLNFFISFLSLMFSMCISLTLSHHISCKKNLPSSGFSVQADQKSENGRKRKEKQTLQPGKRTKEILGNMRMTTIPILICAFRMVSKDL